jgi:HTH-type transcriptional regulator / antitoxin HipB
MTPIDSTQTLGTTLRASRKKLGLTQSELALTAGVGLRFIVELEAGKPTVQLEQVLRVIGALGGQIQLFGLPGASSSAEAVRDKQ